MDYRAWLTSKAATLLEKGMITEEEAHTKRYKKLKKEVKLPKTDQNLGKRPRPDTDDDLSVWVNVSLLYLSIP